ncbi:MAG: hypothetical protein KAI43_04275 [Candidatus Aureabacteria bacterium]|nr:hypothetical protein [Candidatus Auribacterota bacterium]
MKSIFLFIILSSLLSVFVESPLDQIQDEKYFCEKAIQEAIRFKQREGGTYLMMSKSWKEPIKNFTFDYEIIKSDKDENIWYFWIKFTNGFIYMFELFPLNDKWYMLVLPPEMVLFEHSFPSNASN